MLSSRVRRLMENARDGSRPDVPPAVWEFYFTKECTQKKKFSIMQQYCRDPTGKTMTVSELHMEGILHRRPEGLCLEVQVPDMP